MKNHIFIALFIITITGCSESNHTSADEKTTPEALTVSLNKPSAIPNLDRSNYLAGIDMDSNGVRDDIQIFIDASYSDASQHAAATQSAKALQKAILVDTTNIIAVKEANKMISEADHCIYSQFDGTNNSKPPAQVSQEIESLMTNTKARLLAYLAFSKALNGTSWTTPEGDTCE